VWSWMRDISARKIKCGCGERCEIRPFAKVAKDGAPGSRDLQKSGKGWATRQLQRSLIFQEFQSVALGPRL
jgi:hypothetical protein